MSIGWAILLLISFFLIIEMALHLFISTLRKRFNTIIITNKDKIPEIDKTQLNKFIEHGYDSELGWVRKPNTSKTVKTLNRAVLYHINYFGARKNPGYENRKIKIVTFGDSYTFSKEVNDNETWQHYLSKLTSSNVVNFGVGNYGLDQAFLRFKRELPRIEKAKIIVVGVVPNTIQRNLSVWKHYSEFGNIFGFKPRFILEAGVLKLIKNPINNPKKFFQLKNIIPKINKYDYFYSYFNKDLFTFPYTISIIKNPKRKLKKLIIFGGKYLMELLHLKPPKNLKIDKIKRGVSYDLENNIRWYKNKELIALTLAIIKEFKKQAEKNNMKLIFMMMPQDFDLDHIKRKGDLYYKSFIQEVKKIVPTIDLTENFVKHDLKELFIFREHSKYYKSFSGHYGKEGNKIVADIIHKFINKDLKIEI